MIFEVGLIEKHLNLVLRRLPLEKRYSSSLYVESFSWKRPRVFFFVCKAKLL